MYKNGKICFVTAMSGKLDLILERMTTDCRLHGPICKFKFNIFDSGLYVRRAEVKWENSRMLNI